MDVFDAADYGDLLPRRLLRCIGWGLVGFAILAPTPFQDWYIGQAQQHAAHLTEEFVDLMPPPPSQPTAPPTNKDAS
ncbi:hypothetical protein RB608_16050 [Nocardioides sp. LHD-245]|uniref:hypothetical protein n=1 Tax=Nocardioides sp. LHD-245 TaxID=3051387 RepID=UPI0027E0467B|nr:hypothetical protein [Nocardioides sp. LHD-245]